MYLSRDELRSLRKRSDLMGAAMIAHAWLMIFGAMGLFVWLPGPLTFVLAVMIIGTRQLGLAILMHDGAHGLLFRSRRLNDWAGQWLCAFPTGANLLTYRPYHFVHHRRNQQDDDPDLPLSAKFPIALASMRRKTIRDLTGQTFYRQYAAGRADDEMVASNGLIDPKRALNVQSGPIVTNVLLFALLAMAGYWWLYPTLWLVPLATWRMWVTRLRNIAEHAVLEDRNHDLKNARTTMTSWWERMFVAPYFVNYHLEHHLYMWVPCYNLPKAHRLLMQKEFAPQMEVRHGYWSVLKAAVFAPGEARA